MVRYQQLLHLKWQWTITMSYFHSVHAVLNFQPICLIRQVRISIICKALYSSTLTGSFVGRSWSFHVLVQVAPKMLQEGQLRVPNLSWSMIGQIYWKTIHSSRFGHPLALLFMLLQWHTSATRVRNMSGGMKVAFCIFLMHTSVSPTRFFPNMHKDCSISTRNSATFLIH